MRIGVTTNKQATIKLIARVLSQERGRNTYIVRIDGQDNRPIDHYDIDGKQSAVVRLG